jgi:site-specific DNA-cytosine methylase
MNNSNKIKFGTIIPLIGGSTIGCVNSASTLPEFHLSYNAFSNNENHLERYYPTVPMYRLDSDDLQIPNKTFDNIDYVTSTCPCAGLSLLNAARGSDSSRGSSAPQNKWMYESSDYVLENVKPKVLWGENAPGLFTTMGEGVVLQLKKIAEKHNYSFSLVKTNTELHGIPQKRIRTFYFFWNTPTVPMINWKYRTKKTLAEYLTEIPSDASLQDMFMVDGKISDYYKPYAFVLEREGLSHADFSKKHKKGSISQYLDKNILLDECIEWLHEHHPTSGFSNKEGKKTFIDVLEHQKSKRLDGKGYWDASPMFFTDSFSALIGKNMFNGVHPSENRYLNVREMLHLMGMPHDFEILNSSQINHIAQNVPVKTAQDMADEVKKFCEGALTMTPYKFMKQDNTTQKIVETEELNKEEKKQYRVSNVI